MFFEVLGPINWVPRILVPPTATYRFFVILAVGINLLRDLFLPFAAKPVAIEDAASGWPYFASLPGISPTC